jgi:hypothetical protein
LSFNAVCMGRMLVRCLGNGKSESVSPPPGRTGEEEIERRPSTR